MAKFPGINHIAVTVSDLDRSREWYRKLFDADPVLDEQEEKGTFHHAVWAVGDGQLFGIHKHNNPSSNDPCDELRPGIDHVSFACGDRNELKQWQSKLEDLQVEHGGIVEASYGAGLAFRDPDNNPLEFFVLGGAS